MPPKRNTDAGPLRGGWGIVASMKTTSAPGASARPRALARSLAALARSTNASAVVSRLLAGMLLALLAGCTSAPPQFPQLVATGSLVYPDVAREQGVEGTARVRYDVDVTGTVVNARVVAADPPNTFEQAALDFVLSWRFRPVEVNGNLVVARDIVTEIAFRLDDDRAGRYP